MGVRTSVLLSVHVEENQRLVSIHDFQRVLAVCSWLKWGLRVKFKTERWMEDRLIKAHVYT